MVLKSDFLSFGIEKGKIKRLDFIIDFDIFDIVNKQLKKEVYMKKMFLRLFPSIVPDRKDPYVFIRPAHRLDIQLQYYPIGGLTFFLRFIFFREIHRKMYLFPLKTLYRVKWGYR